MIAKNPNALSVTTPANGRIATGLAPLVRELPADLETPVSVYLKLAGQGPSFLLESVTGGEQLARYSFIGVHASRSYVLRGGQVECRLAGETEATLLPVEGDPLAVLRAELARFPSLPLPGLPRFAGGLVGYLGYEMIRYFEPSVAVSPHPELPDGIFLLADTLVAFDHAFGKLLLIANIYPGEQDEDAAGLEAARPEAARSEAARSEAARSEAARNEAAARLDAIEQRLAGPLPHRPQAAQAGNGTKAAAASSELRSNVSREHFVEAVKAAKEHIAAGDIFQVVLSQRLSRQTQAEPFAIYRALRRLNPSPYMYFFDFDGLAGDPPLQVIGASPELHVRLEGRKATVRPIAGTRPRGKSPDEDTALERELLADPKERAEHVMLVDLARNDLGRVCSFGSVTVPEQMVVERYSHVMHIVSQVEGQLRPELDAFDLVRATFPAGTVSGAPKIRAMQIIDALERGPRGTYAGAVGYFASDGSLDTCITIRTLLMRGNQVSIQAGAGIVADSDPETEYQETLNKARALAVAVEMAEQK